MAAWIATRAPGKGTEMRYFKHLFGLCKKPIDFDEYEEKVRTASPGKLICVSEDVFHWDICHRKRWLDIPSDEIEAKLKEFTRFLVPPS